MEHDSPYESRQDYSILFADIKGFSQLKSFQQGLYIKEVLQRIADSIYNDDHKPEQANTWGDGLVAFFRSQTSALRCALTLRDTFLNTDWEGKGLPTLKIRISLHAGEVFYGKNPVTGKPEIIGTEVNRAARVEPIVAPNQVYATKDFISRCKSDQFRFQLLGNVILPKDWGAEEIYLVSRAHEEIDPTQIRSSILKLEIADMNNLFPYPSGSKFGRRLSVSTQAKAAIADYCIKADFWRKEDITFIESGTLPVFMALELYRRCDPVLRPKMLITNNLGCIAVAMMVDELEDESYAEFPDDAAMNCILTGGRVLDDYAATIPEDLIGGNEDVFWQSGKMVEYLKAKGVNHVIMMVTKITKDDGPCAMSISMRRFKKLLLRYVAENHAVRLSILCEADKLARRQGWPADSIDLPGIENARYWDSVLGNGRTTVIAAVSPEMSNAEVGYAKRELRALEKSGASCVLLDKGGNIMSLDVS